MSEAALAVFHWRAKPTETPATGENSFAHKGEPLNAAATKKVIGEANVEWRKHKAPKADKK